MSPTRDEHLVMAAILGHDMVVVKYPALNYEYCFVCRACSAYVYRYVPWNIVGGAAGVHRCDQVVSNRVLDILRDS